MGEEDYNFDGKPELIRFTITAQTRFPVNSFKMLLQFSYALQVSAHTPEQPSSVLNEPSHLESLSSSCKQCGSSVQWLPHVACTLPAGSQQMMLDAACCFKRAAAAAVHAECYAPEDVWAGICGSLIPAAWQQLFS